MKIGMHEIADRISRRTSKQEKIEELRSHCGNAVFMNLLKLSLDPTLEWIPPPDVKYRPNHDLEQEALFYSQMPKLLKFLADPRINPHAVNLNPDKVKKLTARWLGLLEDLHPADALLLMNVRNKKPLAEGLTRKVVQEALPNLLQ